MNKKLVRIIGTVVFALLICLAVQFNVEAKGQENLKVSFVDIGQGDCALLESDGKFMLIDGGPTKAGPSLVAYLKERGVTKLDYVLATHPHADHTGGLVDVLKEFKVDKLIKTDAAFGNNTYYDFLAQIFAKNIDVVEPKVGNSFQFGTAKITFLAPNAEFYTRRKSDFEQLNNMSIVVKVENGENSFLFTGDAEKISELEMIKGNNPLKADVLKVGHHGAATSTSVEFVSAVQPSMAVISCEKANTAGFPRPSVLKNLKNADVYRTDISSTITMTSDGKEITVDKTPFTYAKALTDTKELYNIKNLSLTSSESEMTLLATDAPDEYEYFYNNAVYLDFAADYGVSSMKNIQYVLYPMDEEDEFEPDAVSWKKLSGTDMTIEKDFIGNVYVKYTNNLGNTIIRKTNGFCVDLNAPDNATVDSNIYGVSLSGVNATTSYKLKTKEPVTLTFNADFGVSMESLIEYMVVNKGVNFDKTGAWTEGNTVTLTNGFSGRVYVKFTDNAGNTTTVKTSGITIE